MGQRKVNVYTGLFLEKENVTYLYHSEVRLDKL